MLFQTRQAHVFKAALENDRWPAHERGVIETHEEDGLEVPVGELRGLDGDVERHRPRHARRRAHAVHVGVAQRLEFIGLLDLAVHHPELRAHVPHVARSPREQPAEDRALLRHQHRRKGEAAYEHHVFRAVTQQHLESEVIHGEAELPAGSTRFARRRVRRTTGAPGRLNRRERERRDAEAEPASARAAPDQGECHCAASCCFFWSRATNSY